MSQQLYKLLSTKIDVVTMSVCFLFCFVFRL